MRTALEKLFIGGVILLSSGLFFCTTKYASAAACGGVTACNCGDTVSSNYVLPSDLSCNVSTALSLGANNVTIDGGGHSLTSTRSDLTFTGGIGINTNSKSGVTVKNFSNITGFKTGVNLSGTGNTIQDNTFSGNVGRSILVAGNSNTISGNTINNNFTNVQDTNGAGIYINSGVTGTTVSNNILTNNAKGIFISSGATGNTFTGNSVSGTRIGNWQIGVSTSAFQNSIDTTNLSDGYPVYFLNSISDQTYDGEVLGKLGMFWCNDCHNVTLQNVTFAPNNNIAILLLNSTSTTIINNIIPNASTGIQVQASDLITVSNNTINNESRGSGTPAGIFLSSATSTVSGNAINNGEVGITISGSSSHNTIQSNILRGNITDFTNSGGVNTFTNNTIVYPISGTSTMLTMNEITRMYNVGDTVNFTATLRDSSANDCSSCTYTAVTYPTETVTTDQAGNTVTGSFSPSKAGTYSLVFTVTDNNGNSEKKNFLFLIGNTSSTTTRAYLHYDQSDNGQPRGNGLDAQISNGTAPISTETWWCSGWTQNNLNIIPSYPLASISSLAVSTSQKTQANVTAGVQRIGTYTNPEQADGGGADATTTVTASTADYSSFSHTFSSLNWMMDSAQNWFWTSFKLGDFNGISFTHQQTTSSSPSYVDYTYDYANTAPVQTISNNALVLLSATAPSDATTTVSMVLDNPTSEATSTSITLTGLNRAFLSKSVTITDGTTMVTTSVSANTTETLSAVPLDIIPSASSIDVTVSAWNTTGSEEKTWTESSTSSGITSLHTISGLTPNTTYVFTLDNTASTSLYTSDNNGVITFDYTGGYSTHTFDLQLDTTVPIVSMTAPSSGDTVTGASVTLTATASDDVGLASIQFIVEGTHVGVAGSASPYSITWDSTSVPDGSYSVIAVAEDSSGNQATSTAVIVDVDNTEPVLSSINASPGSSSASISWATDESADSQVEYGLTTNYTASTTLDSTLTVSHSTTITGLNAVTTYHYRVISSDAFGHQSTSTDQIFTTSSVPSLTNNSNGPIAGSSFGPPMTVMPKLPVANAPVQMPRNSATASTTTFSFDLQLNDENGAVQRLQQFLIEQGYLAEGYDTGYFGALTLNALKTFQLSNNISPAAGYFGPLTRAAVNAAPEGKGSIESSKITFMVTLYRGMTGAEVTKLQQVLSRFPDIYPSGLITGYFGSLTEAAVQKFQLTKSIVASPTDPGYGIVGPLTRATLNNL